MNEKSNKTESNRMMNDVHLRQSWLPYTLRTSELLLSNIISNQIVRDGFEHLALYDQFTFKFSRRPRSTYVTMDLPAMEQHVRMISAEGKNSDQDEKIAWKKPVREFEKITGQQKSPNDTLSSISPSTNLQRKGIERIRTVTEPKILKLEESGKFSGKDKLTPKKEDILVFSEKTNSKKSDASTSATRNSLFQTSPSKQPLLFSNMTDPQDFKRYSIRSRLLRSHPENHEDFTLQDSSQPTLPVMGKDEHIESTPRWPSPTLTSRSNDDPEAESYNIIEKLIQNTAVLPTPLPDLKLLPISSEKIESRHNDPSNDSTLEEKNSEVNVNKSNSSTKNGFDIDSLAEKVYQKMMRRQLLERERKGLY